MNADTSGPEPAGTTSKAGLPPPGNPQREYRLLVIEPDGATKGQFLVGRADVPDYSELRFGLADALYWIQVQEEILEPDG